VQKRTVMAWLICMEIRPERFRLSLVLNSVFFPLTSPEAFRSFSSRGFDILVPQGRLPTGARVYFGGPFAQKNGVVIDSDNNRNMVGTEAKSNENMVSTFLEVMNILKEDFFVDLNKDLNYVELIAHFIVSTKANPFVALQAFASVRNRKAIDEILQTQTSDYRVSIVPSGMIPSGRKWFEINISPRLTMPTKAYWIEVVYRDETHDRVTSFAEKSIETISRLINVVEEKS